VSKASNFKVKTSRWVDLWKLSVFGLTTLRLFFSDNLAKADCAAGANYAVTVQNTTVRVLPIATSRNCGGSIPMLRQDVASGAIVQLFGYCAQGAYVDECVPPGTYRYGFAVPYDCSEQGCGAVYYWGTATATASISTGCSLSAGNAAPTPYPGPAPWPADGSNYKNCSSGCTFSVLRSGPMSLHASLAALTVLWALWKRRRRA
jgi:hypothetical protein